MKSNRTGGYLVSRVIGDFDVKEDGSICVPFIKSIKIDRNIDKYVLIIRNGFWDVLED